MKRHTVVLFFSICVSCDAYCEWKMEVSSRCFTEPLMAEEEKSRAVATSSCSITPAAIVEFVVTEGTFMSVDASPDGTTLVFDLLGQLYSLPIDGGIATPLAPHAWAWDAAPRYSPDGKEIAFISDRDGLRKLWLLDTFTRTVRKVSSMEEDAHWITQGYANSPRWLPMGREIAVLRRFRGSEIVALEHETGKGRWMWQGKLDRIGAPAFSQREHKFFVSNRETVQRDGQDITGFALYRVDRATGKHVRLTAPGAKYDEFKPELSHDGRLLAYGRFMPTNGGELIIRDLRTSTDRHLVDLTGVDEPFRLDIDETLPNYAFTPDDRYIVISLGGGLKRISVSNGEIVPIPFEVTVRRAISAPVRPMYELHDDSLRVRAFRDQTVSRDGSIALFSALGDLWIRTSEANNSARRLTVTSTELDLQPTLSSDGSKAAYVAVMHTDTKILRENRLKIVDLITGEAETLGEANFSYFIPRWSPDNNRLAVVRRRADSGESSELGWIDVASKSFHRVGAVPSFYGYVQNSHAESERAALGYHQSIEWSENGKHLYVQAVTGNWYTAPLTLIRFDLEGGKRRVIASADRKFIRGIIPSSDMEHAILLGRDRRAYLAPLPSSDEGPAKLSLDMPKVRRLSDDGAMNPRWISSDKLSFGFMEDLFVYSIDNNQLGVWPRLELEVPRKQNRGTFAIRNARIVTVAGRNGAAPIIEHGTILVKDRRISDVGLVPEVTIPRDAVIIEGSGLTIMPGIIDVHYHGLGDSQPDLRLRGMKRALPSRLDSALAYGVTTSFDAGSSQPNDRPAYWRELLEVGLLRGPRYLFDGRNTHSIVIRPASRESVSHQIRQAIRQKKLLGSGPCLKNMGLMDRSITRALMSAAREEGLCYVGHTWDLTNALTYIIDGVAPHHWSSLPDPLYDDVRQLILRSRTTVSPHLAISAASTHPEQGQLIRAHGDFMRSKLPPEQWNKFMRHYGDQYRRDYEALPRPKKLRSLRAFRAAKSAIQIIEAGGRIAISGDSAIVTDSRAEMVLFQSAGGSPEDIIRSSTMLGAEVLGLDKEIGSLEPGKVADFLVLTRNPLDDVFNTIFLKWTVVDGIIYDSNSLNVLSPIAAGGSARR